MRFEPSNSIAQIRNELFTALPSLKPKSSNDRLPLRNEQNYVNAHKTSEAIINESKENNTVSVELCEPYPLRIFSDYSKSLLDLGIRHDCVMCIYVRDE